MPAVRSEPVYPMNVSERLTGLSRRQIRYYERSGLLRPYRTPGGHRLYSPAEIETLQTIRLLSTRGYRTVEAIRRRLAAIAAAQSPFAALVTASVTASSAATPRGGENDSGAYFGRTKTLQPTARATASLPARTLATATQAGKGV